MTTDDETTAALTAIRKREAIKSMEMLMGMVTAIVADLQLHDLEIKLLSTWLAGHPDVTSNWPGSVIARKVAEVLEDGVITEVERAHLLSVLRELTITDFAMTGSAAPEVIGLPVDDSVNVEIRDATVCHTGTFLFGTRAACERLTELAGGVPQAAVNNKTAFLVIGTQVSPGWVHTSFGRKIQRAAEMREAGQRIQIISERRWLAAVGG